MNELESLEREVKTLRTPLEFLAEELLLKNVKIERLEALVADLRREVSELQGDLSEHLE